MSRKISPLWYSDKRAKVRNLDSDCPFYSSETQDYICWWLSLIVVTYLMAIVKEAALKLPFSYGSSLARRDRVLIALLLKRIK